MKSVIATLSIALALLQRPSPQERADLLRTSTDVVFLEGILLDDATAARAAPLGLAIGTVRQWAYVRLGVLGTPEAVGALRRVEADARTWTLTPPHVPREWWTFPTRNLQGYRPEPWVTLYSPDGSAVGLMNGAWLGGADLFLISHTPGGDWTRPKLIARPAYPTMERPSLSWSGPGVLQLSFTQGAAPRAFTLLEGPAPQAPLPGPAIWVIRIEDVIRDTDGDGWTDDEEARLGLNPRSRDTDGDGLADGEDASPSYAAPRAGPTAQDAVVSQALFATYGVGRSRTLLLVEADHGPLQTWGLRGPVIFGVNKAQWRATHAGSGTFVRWELMTQTADAADVRIADEFGLFGGSAYFVRLRRIEGAWIVVEHRLLSTA